MKARNILRDLVLYLGIMVFPFMTIKALMFRWSIWLQKVAKEHKEYNRQLDEIEGLTNKTNRYEFYSRRDVV